LFDGVHAYRLQKQMVESCSLASDPVCKLAVAGHGYKPHSGFAAPGDCSHFHRERISVDISKIEVALHDIEPIGINLRQSVFAAMGNNDAVTAGVHEKTEHFTRIRIVLHDENAGSRVCGVHRDSSLGRRVGLAFCERETDRKGGAASDSIAGC